MVIYYELVFIDNILLNYLVIFLCTKICAINIKPLRTILVSVVSTCITILLVSINYQIIYSLPVKFAVSFFSCAAYFGLNGIKQLLRHFFIFTCVCFVVSGLLYFFILNSSIKTNSLYSIYSNILFLRILCGIIFVILTYRIYIYINKTSINRAKCISEIKLSHKNHTIKVNAFFDTGNMLFDGTNLLPVVLLNKNNAQKLIDNEVFEKVVIDIATINGKNSILGYKTLEVELESTKYNCIVGIMDNSFKHDCILNPNQFI